MHKYIGKSIPRHDAREKATGLLKYAGDLKIEGLLYARLKTSEIAHGKLISVDAKKAEDESGVKAVYHHFNTPGYTYNEHQWMAGQEMIEDQVLFSETLRHYGDRVAMVVADNRETARIATQLVDMEIESLPVLIDPEHALDADAVKIHSESNLVFEKSIELGQVESVFSGAHRVVEDKIETPKQHHAAMEPHVCLAIPEANGHLTLVTPCQVVFQVQLIVAKAIGVPISHIRVIKANIGGSFGGKGQPTIEAPCAYAAMQLGKPVLLETDRLQSMTATKTRHASIGWIKSVVDESGIIRARDLSMLVDTGAYCTNGQAIVMAMAKKYFRLYEIENTRFSGKSVYTNTPVGGACRGYGSPQVHAVTEIHMDNLAREMDMDPVELRLKNLIQPFAKDPLGGPAIGEAQAVECVQRGAEAFNWKERYAYKNDASARFKRGVGMACATHGNGYHGAYPDFINMSLKMHADGKLVLNAALHDLGCGTVTSIQQIVAEVLDVSPYDVHVLEADTSVNPYDSAGTQASRVTYVCGGAAKKAAEEMKINLLKFAGEMLKCPIEKLYVEDSQVKLCESPRENSSKCAVTYEEILAYAYLVKQEEVKSEVTYQSPGNPGVYAANFAQVIVDTFTGHVTITDFLAVHDIGKAINRDFVEGQIHGGVQMSLGMALMEEMDFNAKGILQSRNFSKYHIFNAPEMPEVKTILIETGEDGGPFGAKSVGEVCAVAAAPAVINAINHALGTRISKLPATPERIVEAVCALED